MPDATLTRRCARLAPRLRALFPGAGNTLLSELAEALRRHRGEPAG